MAGNEVDYAAFVTFFEEVTKSGEEGKTAEGMTDVQFSGPITGSVGIDSALSFRAWNRQAISSIAVYWEEQAKGQVFLAEAAAAVALAYHEGDLAQQGAVSDVMNGILNPSGHEGTAQQKYFPVEGDPNYDAGQAAEGDSEDSVPPPTVDSEGNIVDANGAVLFYANGTPGDPSVLAASGITSVGSDGTSTGTSPYLAYINSVNEAQRRYYSQYTGIPEGNLDGEDVDQFADPNSEQAEDAGTQAMGGAFLELVQPTESTGPEEEYVQPPQEPVNLTGYTPPAPPPAPPSNAGGPGLAVQ